MTRRRADSDGGLAPGGPERAAELEARIDGLERELARNQSLLREASAVSRTHANELRQARRELEMLQRRRSVKLALWGSTRARQIRDTAYGLVAHGRRELRSVRRYIRDRAGRRRLRASPEAESALIATVRRDLPPANVISGPLVSIVILNRDGRQHLERCLSAVAATAYRNVEIVVVDNGSTDGSPELAERFDAPFPLRVVRNQENRSFSEANGQGVAVAAGDLICFLNNDVDPITEHWLGYLVETLTSTGAAAVGARLIFPRHRGGTRAGARHADLTLQHAGVVFDRAEPIPMARVIGAGEDPLTAAAAAVEDRPALTAACLLVRRTAFDEVGGFTPAYDYGFEDVDLCLKLTAAGGRLVYDGRAALWHHESATRAADRPAYLARVARNRDVFVDHWGPRIFRESILDAALGTQRMSEAPFHVAIALTSADPDAGFGDWFTGHELGDALEALGWRVSYLERVANDWYQPDPSVEAVIVLLDACDIRRLPRNIVTIAWVRNWPERWLGRPWFDEYDVVFGSSEPILDMIRDGSAKVATLLPIATNPARFVPTEPSPELACDVLFTGSYWGEDRDVVHALPALAEHGISVRVHGRGWSGVPGIASFDHGFLAYQDLPQAYASARIVVDDAASSTKECGSVNSRVFDALAVGSVVVSNGRTGVHQLFDTSFPTWSDAQSLVDLVESILRDPGPIAERVREYRARVLAEHTYAARARTVRDAIVAWASATRYGLRIGVPGWDVAEGWGDYHFARSLQRSLERGGHPTRLHFLPDWGAAVAAREDVTVHLFGLKEAPTRLCQVNLLWQISHPDLASAAMYDRYDHVFVASDPFAAEMASLANVPVTALHQATDPERFKPTLGGPRHELLFVANSRGVRRRIVEDLAGTSHDLAVFGRGWTPNLLEPRFLKGERIANDDLARYYSAASIVLNDHWDDMGAEGFISNRVYDALACGAFVISDDVEGIAAEFDGAVPTYRGRAELEALIERYLTDPGERRRLAEHGQSVVLARHTFDVRAGALRDAADRIGKGRPARVVVEAPG